MQQPTREELIARIAYLEAGRAERKAERRRNRKRNGYYKIVTRTNDEFNRKFHGRHKGQDVVLSANLPDVAWAEKRTARKWNWG
jgi:hypothetical protein